MARNIEKSAASLPASSHPPTRSVWSPTQWRTDTVRHVDIEPFSKSSNSSTIHLPLFVLSTLSGRHFRISNKGLPLTDMSYLNEKNFINYRIYSNQETKKLMTERGWDCGHLTPSQSLLPLLDPPGVPI